MEEGIKQAPNVPELEKSRGRYVSELYPSKFSNAAAGRLSLKILYDCGRYTTQIRKFGTDKHPVEGKQDCGLLMTVIDMKRQRIDQKRAVTIRAQEEKYWLEAAEHRRIYEARLKFSKSNWPIGKGARESGISPMRVK